VGGLIDYDYGVLGVFVRRAVSSTHMLCSWDAARTLCFAGSSVFWQRRRSTATLPLLARPHSHPPMPHQASHLQLAPASSPACCCCSLQGWQTTKGFTYLRRPVEARMRFTPALSK